MMNTMTFPIRFRYLLLAATLFSMLCVPSLQAALLKDIRLGEYNTFTRIVFEFDQAPPTIPDISVNEAELRVTFKDLTAELKRKIATKQSPHVSAVQIWLEDDHLSAVFKVDAPFTHSKISSISNPPRILVDVHWQPAAQGQALSETTVPQQFQSNTSPTNGSAPIPAPSDTAVPLLPQESLQLPTHPQSAAPEAPSETAASSAPSENPSAEEQNQTPEALVLKPPATPSQETLSLQPETNANIPSPVSSAHANRLQYYLVIGLVVLTIAILILLVLMLLTKYRWGNNRRLFNIDDHLKEQQAKIETINGRIKEQLKNYEKA